MQTSRFPPWRWFQTNWARHFFSTLFQWDKNILLLNVYLKKLPKLSVHFGNRNSQGSQNQYPDPVLNFGFTEPQYSDKCWSICHWNTISLPLEKHTHKISMIIRFMVSGFIGTSYLARVGIITWLNDIINVPKNIVVAVCFYFCFVLLCFGFCLLFVCFLRTV